MSSRKLLSVTAGVLLSLQLLLAPTAEVSAQARTPRPETAEAAKLKTEHEDKAQKLFDHGEPGRPRFSVLEEVRATKALPATSANVAAVLGRLRNVPIMEHSESVQLVRLAGDLHRESKNEKDKAEIRSLLSATATSSANPLLGKAAALTYSRLGYFKDSISVLSTARRKGFIPDDDYYGDLVHLLPFVKNANEQQQLRQLVADGNNAFSRLILVSLMQASNTFDQLTPVAARQVADIVTKNPPLFTNPPDTLSLTEVMSYNDWAITHVRLTAKFTKEPEAVVMARLVQVDKPDPRSLVALMRWEPTAGMVREGLDAGSLAKMDKALENYAAGSKNDWIKQAATDARGKLKK
ncbi:MAG: hypothetical protein LH617_01960 [Ramlibacter sp.]|nr:hypothetical protein [Ramlibacter sp.]